MNKTISLVVACLFTSTFLMAQTSPNIIVIFTDDHGWADLGVNGVVDDIKTPNLDQLAADGVQFTNGYVTGPQCIPSRAGILSGRYQQSFGVDDNRYAPMPIEVNTVPERLQEAGYRTGQVGKWHLDPNVDSEEWLRDNTYKGQTLPSRANRVIPFQDKLPYYPGNQGFDEYFCGSISNYWANFDLNGNDLNPSGETQVITGRDRLDIQSDAALAFINRNFEDPFFLYLAYFAPHVPLASSEKYLSRFPGEMPERRRYALAMISAVDEGVGRIREQLRDHGILDSTLIFFIGDNGAPLAIHMEDLPLNENGWDGSLNTPLRGEKGMLSEGGIRVPYLMSWPGQVDAGQVLDMPVSSLDVGATAIAASGLEQDADLEGKNILELLADSALAAERPLFWRFWAQGAIRIGDWKYLNAGETEYLFDLKSDPTESENLRAENPERAATMLSRWKEWNATLLRPEDSQLNSQEVAWYQHYFYQCDGEYQWHFDDLNHWTLNDRLTGTVNNGVARLTISGEDPFMNYSGTICIDSETSRYIRFKAKNNTNGNNATIYYKNSVTNAWNFKSIPITTDDAELKSYTTEMTGDPNWTGTINTLRFDPPGSEGTMELDYLGILSADQLGTTMDVRESKTSSDFVSIFPNPVVDYLTVNLYKSGDASMKLSTIHGQTIASFDLSESRTRISLTDLPAGVYAIRIEQGTELFGAKIFIVK
jgi:arylsulfatase A-like enzyme